MATKQTTGATEKHHLPEILWQEPSSCLCHPSIASTMLLSHFLHLSAVFALLQGFSLRQSWQFPHPSSFRAVKLPKFFLSPFVQQLPPFVPRSPSGCLRVHCLLQQGFLCKTSSRPSPSLVRHGLLVGFSTSLAHGHRHRQVVVLVLQGSVSHHHGWLEVVQWLWHPSLLDRLSCPSDNPLPWLSALCNFEILQER